MPANQSRRSKLLIFRFERTVQHAKYPTLATTGSGAYDLHSAYPYTIKPAQIIAVDTGLKVEYISPEISLLICSRSSMAFKGITCTNAPGLIDSDFFGNLKIILNNISDVDYEIAEGDRVAQMLVYQTVPITMYDVTGGHRRLVRQNPKKRTGGFGSTGT